MGVIDVWPLCLPAAASAKAWEKIRTCSAWAGPAGGPVVEAGLEFGCQRD